MKGSEALLRAIANEGGEVEATQLDSWVAQLKKAGLLEARIDEDTEAIFYWTLTDKAKAFLQKKGVRL